MAESAEHEFLSSTILSILEKHSCSRLYTYREAERRKFDFACDLAATHRRTLSGQTLWKHTEGIDKDVRMLLTEPSSDVLVYIARDTVKARATFFEATSDYRRAGLGENLVRLRVFWVPQDLDADIEQHRGAVYNLLQSSVSQDLLLSVVLEGITGADVSRFASWCNGDGLALATLAEIASFNYMNYSQLGKRLGVDAGRIKERIILLTAIGLIQDSVPHTTGSLLEAAPKGRVLLDILSRISRRSVHQNDEETAGLDYICRLLGIDAAKTCRWAAGFESGHYSDLPAGDVSVRLALDISGLRYYDCIELPAGYYSLPHCDASG